MKYNVNILGGLTRKREMLFTVPDPRGPDPDLEIRGPPGHPDPYIRGGGGVQKTFSALRASVWSKNKGGPPLASPLDPALLQLITFETRSNGNQPRRVSSFT